MHLPESFRGGELTLLQGGLTNRSYRLSLPRGDYFLRIMTNVVAIVVVMMNLATKRNAVIIIAVNIVTQI